MTPVPDSEALPRQSSLSVSDFIIAAIISSIVVFAAVGTKSFWGDEIHSINAASRSVAGLLSTLASDYHPPLYFLLLKGWIELFGTSELALRIFQGAQGFSFILLSLLLFRRLFPRDRYHPFWLLLIASSELWLFMPMLRYYTLAASLGMFSTLMLLRWLEAPGTIRNILLGLSYVLLLYCQYLSGIVIILHAAFIFLKHKPHSMNHSLINGAALVLFVPWMTVTFNQVSRLLALDHGADLNLTPEVIPLKFMYSIFAFMFGETMYPFDPPALASIVMIIAAVALSARTLRTDRDTTSLWFGVVFTCFSVLCTAVVTTFVSIHTSFMYTPSRTFFALPFLFVFFGTLYSLMEHRGARIILVSAFLIANLTGIANWMMNRHFLMPVYATPWKEVLDDLEGNSGIILVDESLCYEYYRVRRDGVYPGLWRPDSLNILPPSNLHSSGNSSSSVFLILMGRESSKSEIGEEVVRNIQDRGVKVLEKEYITLDEGYRAIKSRILWRDTYDAKLTLYRYELRQ